MAKVEREIIPAPVLVKISYSKPNQFELIENFNLPSCPTSLQLTKLRLK